MDKRTVYIETSIVSYLTARTSQNLITKAHQAITTRWWSKRRVDFNLVTSRLVLAEAALGDAAAAQKRLRALLDLEIVEVSPRIEEVAAGIVSRHLLPAKAQADALHMAIAACHGVDMLLTWNCRHIANAETSPAILAYFSELKLKPPYICTPLELIGDVHRLS
jgi:predicted nucleic acid-binding protein